jgi:enterochelin esterase-like enzyme
VLHSPHAIPFGAFRSGAINVAADELLQRHAIRPMIIVVPLGTTKAFGGDSEWTDTPGAGRFDAYVVDVAHMIDRRYATLADRRHRALSGLSMGGYGAVNIALHHLKLFSVAESWSGYFTQTPTGPFVHATRAELAAASPAHVVPALAPDIRRRGLRLWLYQGNHDDVPVSAMRAFAREVRGAGATVRADVYRGGHNWGLWRPRVPRALILASAWFAQPPHR